MLTIIIIIIIVVVFKFHLETGSDWWFYDIYTVIWNWEAIYITKNLCKHENYNLD